MSRTKYAIALFALAFVPAAYADDGIRSNPALRLETPSPPLPDPSGINKVRFISLVAPAGGGDSALRVNLISLHHVDPPYTAAPTIPFTIFEGQSVWVGPPAQYVESSANPIPFLVSHTQCEPHYRDWSTVGLFHVTGSHIVPSSVYRVETVSGACVGIEDSVDCLPGGANVSTQLEILTMRWGDVEIPFNTLGGSRQSDIADSAAIMKKFRGVPGSIIKVRAITSGTTAFGEITPSTLNVDIGLATMAANIDAFRGKAYPYKMGKCAGTPTPPSSGACSSDSECTGSNGAPPCLIYCPN